jgi:branched-chain amino acid aminotransferase
MKKLQKPEYVYMAGGLRPWDEALLHVDSEAVNRGLNVFEGIKGYWQKDGSFGFVSLRPHYQRLLRSAHLLKIPHDLTYEHFEAAIFMLVDRLVVPEHDMWARPTLFVVGGHWHHENVSDLVIKAFNHPKAPPEPIALGISTWQRSTDNALPARIKTSANYQVARLARIEGEAHGCDEMILLNQWGRVAEATGSALLMVRDGTVYTPPPSEGVLESITVNIVQALAESMDIPFVRRPIDRTELHIADELAICGTLAEIVGVRALEGEPMAEQSPVFDALRRRFFEAVRGIAPHPAVEMTFLPGKKVVALAEQRVAG